MQSLWALSPASAVVTLRDSGAVYKCTDYYYYYYYFFFFKPSKNEGRKKIEKVKKNGEANVPSGRPTQNYCATKQN